MKITSTKKKPWAVRLGKGIFLDVILHQAETQEQAEKWQSKYLAIHQRDALVKILGTQIINLLEKKEKDDKSVL